MTDATDKVRLDLWLWAARFFKTRSLAQAAVEGGRVHVDGERSKPSRSVRPGNVITITREMYRQEVVVVGISRRRGSATVAQALYDETAASIEARDRAVAARRLQNAGLTPPSARPDRRDRRAIKALKEQPEA
jgi:ribosome-associated heat shock protein Hsp15